MEQPPLPKPPQPVKSPVKALESPTISAHLGVTVTWYSPVFNVPTLALLLTLPSLILSPFPYSVHVHTCAATPRIWCYCLGPAHLISKQKHSLEMIQRRAARWVTNRHHNTSSVTDMLHTLGWTSLEHRRATSRLCMLFQIYHGSIGIPHDPYILPYRHTP